MSEYDIRWYRPADRAQFLDRYAEVLDTWSHSPEWFDWKYVSNPYVDHVPIVVATADGDLVGARGFFALPMVVDGEPRRTLQPCDTMVHRDHRGRGLFARMAERAIERYRKREAPFLFGFATEQSGEADRNLGWRRVGTAPLAYRVENVTPLLAAQTTAPGHQFAGNIATEVVSVHNRLRESRGDGSPDARIRREEPVPAETLADIYADAPPETIHAHRDPAFYRWRLSNPNWNYTALIGESGGERAAVVVARTPPGKRYGPEITRVAEVVPLADHAGRERLLRALLAEVRGAFPGSDLFVAPATMPDTVLRDQGFYREGAPPLSYLRSGRPHLVRALDSWAPGGRALTDGDNWTTTLLELDTG
ncbi:GNAT family N-acetyltransferase [Haloarcula onubensis]|uniref:GNAT family N-acetyltransferase n=1 Tax=Haloarcula onubensis TaxID=2950539 RepID=A0ABU2FSB1_9EURY|nr:GNAT family N-acetyltransferase [Halomicroarcula sp. S3CR25-11]MDS0283658.1 GNAT family N-acetyltransferase [Halomicroarcula sp. S3CR25-11]